MQSGYRIDDQHAVYYLTFQVVYWLDIFTRQEYRDIILDSFRFCQKEKGLKVHAYVIMSNHVHCILSSNKTDLSTIIKEFKSHTSKKIISAVKELPESRKDWLLFMFERAAKKHNRNSKYQVWTHENQPKEIVTNNFLQQKLDYIHENPVKAGIVENPEDYLYSSARNYSGMICMMKVEVLE